MKKRLQNLLFKKLIKIYIQGHPFCNKKNSLKTGVVSLKGNNLLVFNILSQYPEIWPNKRGGL